jgi:hypothetical protein
MRGYFDTWTDESVSARIRPYNGFDRNQEQYRSIYIEVVNRRILQAGYRLGALLNAYFDPSATNSLQGWASSSRSFDSKARAALGAAYLDRIVLKPISKADIGVQSDLSLIAEFPPDCPHDHEKIETMEF